LLVSGTSFLLQAIGNDSQEYQPSELDVSLGSGLLARPAFARVEMVLARSVLEDSPLSAWEYGWGTRGQGVKCRAVSPVQEDSHASRNRSGGDWHGIDSKL